MPKDSFRWMSVVALGATVAFTAGCTSQATSNSVDSPASITAQTPTPDATEAPNGNSTPAAPPAAPPAASAVNSTTVATTIDNVPDDVEIRVATYGGEHIPADWFGARAERLPKPKPENKTSSWQITVTPGTESNSKYVAAWFNERTQYWVQSRKNAARFGPDELQVAFRLEIVKTGYAPIPFYLGREANGGGGTFWFGSAPGTAKPNTTWANGDHLAYKSIGIAVSSPHYTNYNFEFGKL